MERCKRMMWTVALGLAAAAGPGCSEDAQHGAGEGDPDASATTPDAGAADRPDAAADASASRDEGTVERSELLLPEGMAGIGFDDLQYSATLDRLIAPAGRAGYVALIDPQSQEVTRLGSFSTSDSYASGHGFGTTSAIEVGGLVYAIDRTTMSLTQLDPESGDMLESVALGAAPDYVRYVAATRELWVTEPSAGRFEIFALGDETPPTLTKVEEMAVSGGPESLVLDATGETAFTNTFTGDTVRIDTVTRSETDRWRNGCLISLGLVLDEANARIFVGCAEGKAVALDATDGTELSTLAASGGVDIIAYNGKLAHLYLNGSTVGELTIAGVDAAGVLSELATLPTAASTNSSCVASDPYDNVWVCDANGGRLLRIVDHY